MSIYTCEKCSNHYLLGTNEEYEHLYDVAEKKISRNHSLWSITGKNCPVPYWYTKIAETENMVLYKENNNHRHSEELEWI